MNADEYQAKIVELAQARKIVADCEDGQTMMEQAMRATPDWIALDVAHFDASHRSAELYKEITAAAVDGFDWAVQDKHPHPEVTIKIMTELEYKPEHAKEWAMTAAPLMLKLDVTKFEKHARAVSDTVPLPFVQITHKAQATIASDLSAYIIPVQMKYEEGRE